MSPRHRGPRPIVLPSPKRKWRGDVEHRPPETYQQPPVILTWPCPACRNWTMDGAWRRRRCNWCDAPAPAPVAALFPSH